MPFPAVHLSDLWSGEFLVLVIMLGGGSLLIGLSVLFLWLTFVHDRMLTKTDWDTTEGLVTASSIKEDEGEYLPQVTFRFTAGGKPVTSAQWGLGPHRLGKSEAETVVAKYAPGTHVTVYYDAQHPSTAVLDPDPSQGDAAVLYLLGCAVGSGVTGLYMLFQGLVQLAARH
jgi:hypothetical protein